MELRTKLPSLDHGPWLGIKVVPAGRRADSFGSFDVLLPHAFRAVENRHQSRTAYDADNFNGWIASLLDACAWGVRKRGCVASGAAKLTAQAGLETGSAHSHCGDLHAGASERLFRHRARWNLSLLLFAALRHTSSANQRYRSQHCRPFDKAAAIPFRL